MKRTFGLLVSELVLLFSSILVFRSAWTLLDAMEWARTPAALWCMLVVGTGLTVAALAWIQSAGRKKGR
jgi:dolichyl-phosphate-mannose--protein O-mannosyl transferase